MIHLFDDLSKLSDVQPEAAALSSVHGKALLTCSQLLRSSEAAAAWLRAKGIGRGDGLALGVSALTGLHGVLLLAAMRAGARVASLGNRPGVEWAALARLRARLLTGAGEPLPGVPEAGRLTLSATDVQSFQRAQRVIGLPALAEVSSTTGLVLFSGTSGPLGAVHLPMERLVPRLRDLAARLRLGPGRSLAIALPASSALAIEAKLACWLVGGCVVLPRTLSELQLFLQSGADDVVLSGTVLRALLDASGAPTKAGPEGPGGRAFVVGGPLSPGTAAQAKQHLRREPNLLLAAAEPGLFRSGTLADLSAHHGCIGRPAGAADVQAVDALGRVRPVGQDGLLRVTTPWMALPLSDKAPPAQDDGWWNSSFQGSVEADGRITVSGVLAPVGQPAPG